MARRLWSVRNDQEDLLEQYIMLSEGETRKCAVYTVYESKYCIEMYVYMEKASIHLYRTILWL